MKFLRTLVIALVACFLATNYASAQQTKLSVSTIEQFKEDFAAVPCKDKARLNAVKSLFEKMGADSATISLEKYKS
jgi:hypothetical protein